MAHNLENLRKITYEGEVTEINHSLCYFTMDETIDVYAGYFIAKKKKKRLPLINETIILKNVLLYDRTSLFLNNNSKIINSNNSDDSLMEYMQNFKEFLSRYNIKPVDYKKLKSMYENLIDLQVEIIKDNVQYLEIDLSALLLDVIEVISEDKLTSLLDITIQIPTYIKSNRDKNEVDMPIYLHWYPSINRSDPNDVLIGILNISNKCGFLMVSDTTDELPVVIAKNDYEFSKKILKLLNKFVAIRNYIQITENFKDIGGVQYIYVDIEDISLLASNNVSIIFNTTKEVFTVDDTESLLKINIFILSKSSIIEKKKQKYFFIHVKYSIESDDEEKNSVLKECVFRVNEEHLHLYPTLNDNYTYSIYTNSKEFERNFTAQESESIFTIFEKRLQSYNLPIDLKLKLIKAKEKQLSVNEEEKPYIYSVQEAKEFLKTTQNTPNRKLIHIEGIITQRKFFPPLKGKKTKSKEIKLEAFGIPGNMVHHITLRDDLTTEEEGVKNYVVYETDECYEEALNEYFEGTFPNGNAGEFDEIAEINVFMHNFDHLQCPLDLVPDMRVLFKYVTAEKGKYFKPSLFTSIDVVSYEPETNFSSANAVLDDYDWGPQICLASGNEIPTNTICWGSTVHIKITKLTIKFQCPVCRCHIEEYAIECCKQFHFIWDMSLTLIVRDAVGACKITTNNEEILRILLNKDKKEWGLLRKSLKIIKKFSFYDDDADEDEIEYTDDLDFLEDSEFSKFSNSFTLILRAWNEAQIHHLDLKCRKMENKEQTTDYLPFWWCLGARRSFEPELHKN